MGYEAKVAALDADPRAEGRQAPRAGAAFIGVVILALIAGAAIRFWGIGSRALWLDEGYSAWFSELGWGALWLESPRYETHPPFYYSLLKLWRGVAGDDAAALRSLSALAGLAAIPVLALAADTLARLTSSRRSLLLVAIACGLAALSPRLVIIAQDARPYALLLTAYGLALACWLRLTLSFRSAGKAEGRILDWVGLAVGTSLTLWLHFLGLLYAAALFGALLLTATPGASRARWTRLALASATVLISYLPCLAMLLSRSGDWNSGWVAWDLARFPGAFLDLYGLYEQTEVWTPIAARILFAGLIAAALRQIWRSGDRPLALGLGLLILFPPLAAALLSQLGHPVFVPRTLVALLAPAYLAAAFALTVTGRRFAMLLGGGLALVFAVNLAETAARPSLEPWDEVAAILKQEMAPRDVVWVYPNDTLLPLGRALGSDARLEPLPSRFPALDAAGSRPAGSPAVVAIDGAAALRYARANDPGRRATIWLITRNSGLFDPRGEVAAALASGRRPGRVREWRDIKLQPLYTR